MENTENTPEQGIPDHRTVPPLEIGADTGTAKAKWTRRGCLHLLTAVGATLAPGGVARTHPTPSSPEGEDAPPLRTSGEYAASLLEAVKAMEEGQHPGAVAPLKAALTLDRNEPYGLLTLATLCLHTGNGARAAREFRRARLLLPGEPLTSWGMALSALAQGKTDVGLEAISAQEIGAVGVVSDYLRLLKGEAEAVRQETASVTAEEPDLLRLEIAGLAALRGGDPARGRRLLEALLERPGGDRLTEARAVLLPFLPEVPVQGGAVAPVERLTFPPLLPGPPLNGRATLNPPRPLPEQTSMVAYEVMGGGGYLATINYPPFTTDWNTERFPNGQYTLRTTIFDEEGRELLRRERSVAVTNTDAPTLRRLSEAEKRELQHRLTALLTPRPTRKAAHFALAEQAIRRGDGAAALSHLENVVAIDPLYRNARASVKQYNTKTIGKREGIWCAVTREKIVALTFDDGPHPTATPRLLDALKKEKVVGTFFVVGARAEDSPELLRRMHEEGHELANHSYSHQNLTFMDSVNIERELCRTSVLVRDAIGKRPRFFRPPGGNNNAAVVDAAELLGMAGAYWTVDGIKFEFPPFKPEALANYIVGNIRPGAILLLHNAPRNTIAAIPAIVRGLRAKGYQMVTMSELVRRGRPGDARDARVKPSAMKE